MGKKKVMRLPTVKIEVGQELNTVIAALKFYLDHNQGEPCERSNEIHDLAVGPDDDISMDDEGITGLFNRLVAKRDKTVF